MKQTAVEWLVANIDWQLLRNTKTHYNMIVEKAKEMEKQQGYSEEEVIKFTQTILMQYKFGNTDIEQMELLKETFQLFKNKQR